MKHEAWLFGRYRDALREYEIAQNHFNCCEPAFVDGAIDDLVYAEKNLNRIVKELRDGMGTKVSNN